MNKLLFICSRNQWRSPTAEKVFKNKGYSTRSAGTSPRARHTVSVTDVKWADAIFVMEKKHKNRILASFGKLLTYTPVYILDIPDDYRFMDDDLINHLEDTMAQHLNNEE